MMCMTAVRKGRLISEVFVRPGRRVGANARDGSDCLEVFFLSTLGNLVVGGPWSCGILCYRMGRQERRPVVIGGRLRRFRGSAVICRIPFTLAGICAWPVVGIILVDARERLGRPLKLFWSGWCWGELSLAALAPPGLLSKAEMSDVACG